MATTVMPWILDASDTGQHDARSRHTVLTFALLELLDGKDLARFLVAALEHHAIGT